MEKEYLNIRISNYNKSIQTTPKEVLWKLIEKEDLQNYIAAKVNNYVTSLLYILKANAEIEFITASSPEGMEVYKRTLSFLLEKAVSKLFPGKILTIMHSLGAGYYYEIQEYPLSKKEVQQLELQMREDTNSNKSIIRKRINYQEAVDFLTREKREDKLLLLQTLNMPFVFYYQCDDFLELVDAPIAISSAAVKVFQLIPYQQGMILQFPTKDDLSQPAPFYEQKKIFDVYKKYKKLDLRLNVDTVGALNRVIIDQKIKGLIQVEEALQEGQIMKLAEDIFRRKEVRLIAIAGPSSSGKTTFSKRLELQLRAHGIRPKTISVDNYFIDREQTPLGENGRPDYESLRALRLSLFNQHLKTLLKGEKTQLAHYNFLTGRSSLSKEYYQLNSDEIILIEGIHCLNEQLTYEIPKEFKYKIYVSALTHINLDHANRIPTTDNRIIRRLVRDYQYRGHSASKTLNMWADVRRGEERNIFPFQNDADGYFNSALLYELAVLKTYVEPILVQVRPNDKQYGEANRLLKFLSYFLNLPADFVPSTSILREFIGNSVFSY